ncbi:uncharacterized protein LOC116584623 isoform X2 [Mustela erminea]|uniref:uncharacterized protein LOC116584623 isoform X2 n=1 Tax=Mustela erminea TaxID=36723 RepID=UPI001386CF97|nr:uncharacterized protein LOC116584623 isoform X2 [Mustela erminea]
MHAGGVDRAGGGPSPLGKKSCAPLSCHHIQQRQPCRSGTSGTESPGRWSAWGREAGSPPGGRSTPSPPVSAELVHPAEARKDGKFHPRLKSKYPELGDIYVKKNSPGDCGTVKEICSGCSSSPKLLPWKLPLHF